jgi:acyl carrier protein
MLFSPEPKRKSVTREDIHQFLENLLSAKTSSLDYDTDLVESGLLDSVAMMELLLWLEKSKGFEFRDEDLLPDNFRSINALQAFLTSGDSQLQCPT